jgi:hypothetical protein
MRRPTEPPQVTVTGATTGEKRSHAAPPIPPGRVDAVVGRLIRTLKRTPLVRPVPAVSLSALGLAGVMYVGLCAPNATTISVLLPLTAAARRLGATPGASSIVMYVSITLCCLGLAGMLWANSDGWQPRPRKMFWCAGAAVAIAVNITPVGSSDTASYAAYGRIAALGHDPYRFTPADLPGGTGNPYTELVGSLWRGMPTVYGPAATWIHLAAALIGGSRPWLTIWVLMILNGAAFLLVGYLLLRLADDPVRAGLLWVANPLMIEQLVLGGHLDTYVALAAVAALWTSRRGTTLRHDLTVGAIIGAGAAIKVSAVFVGLGIAIPLLRDRSFGRLARTGMASCVVAFGLYLVSYGLGALVPLTRASTMVISPSAWRLIEVSVIHMYPAQKPGVITAFGFLWPPLTLLLAWYLFNRLSPDVPPAIAAICALTLAWVIVAPWSLPWYASTAWVTLALVPRNVLTRWLTLATGVLAMLHFSGGPITLSDSGI